MLATVSNNVSSLPLPEVIVQVGDNITAADLYIASPLVALGQSVQLTVQVPTGSPVILQLDMGDGLPPVQVTRPANYTAAMEGKVQKRRKRDLSLDPFAPFVVTYQYKRAGRYR